MDVAKAIQDCRREAGVRMRGSSRFPVATAPLDTRDTVYIARDAVGFDFAGEFERMNGEEIFMAPEEAAPHLNGSETIRLLVFRDLQGFYDDPRASDDELMWVHHLDLVTGTLYHEDFDNGVALRPVD